MIWLLGEGFVKKVVFDCLFYFSLLMHNWHILPENWRRGAYQDCEGVALLKQPGLHKKGSQSFGN